MTILRVLHIDDEPDIRALVEISLGLDTGLTLKSCASGLDALAEAVSWLPDVILMDVMMPVIDGPQTLARLRGQKSTAAIPVVFMTARAQTLELAHFMSVGAAGVIPKPFDPMTLASELRKICAASTDRVGLPQAAMAAAPLSGCRGQSNVKAS